MDFLTVFGFFEHEIFGGPIYTIKQKRNKPKRKPANLPDQELIEGFNKYLKEITACQRLSFELPKAIFIKDCDATCARLTIYNGRKVGEPHVSLFINGGRPLMVTGWDQKHVKNTRKKL